MSSQTSDEALVSKLYRQLLDSWNRRNADDYAALLTYLTQFHALGSKPRASQEFVNLSRG